MKQMNPLLNGFDDTLCKTLLIEMTNRFTMFELVEYYTTNKAYKIHIDVSEDTCQYLSKLDDNFCNEFDTVLITIEPITYDHLNGGVKLRTIIDHIQNYIKDTTLNSIYIVDARVNYGISMMACLNYMIKDETITVIRNKQTTLIFTGIIPNVCSNGYYVKVYTKNIKLGEEYNLVVYGKDFVDIREKVDKSIFCLKERVLEYLHTVDEYDSHLTYEDNDLRLELLCVKDEQK